MSTSHDYRTPVFAIDFDRIPDESIDPSKLRPGISGSLLQNGSVPPSKLQPNIPGSLLLEDSVPFSALANDVKERLRTFDPASLADYPNTSAGIYRAVNLYRAHNITTSSVAQLGTNVLIVVPIISNRDYTLSYVGVVCTSYNSPGPIYVGIYDAERNRLATANATITGIGIFSMQLSSTVNIQARTLYYVVFLITSGIFSLATVAYSLLEYVHVSGTTVNMVGVMRFSGTSLPTSLTLGTPRGEGGDKAPLLLQTE